MRTLQEIKADVNAGLERCNAEAIDEYEASVKGFIEIELEAGAA